MSDFMNIRAMLWLSGLAKYSQDIVFLNIDAIRMGHNYEDTLSNFERYVICPVTVEKSGP